MNIALKEWASAIEAIENGTQVILLRKGGIVEAERSGFELRHREFLLFPTYEHQQLELLKPEHTQLLSHPKSAEERGIRIALFCRVTATCEAPPIEILQKLHTEFVWNDRFLHMRYAYKPHLPLSVLFVQAFRLRVPPWIPDRVSYAGCKSWVHLTEEVSVDEIQPVLTAAEYSKRCERILSQIERIGTKVL